MYIYKLSVHHLSLNPHEPVDISTQAASLTTIVYYQSLCKESRSIGLDRFRNSQNMIENDFSVINDPRAF